MSASALIFDLIARGNAPAEFGRLAGAADKAAASTARAAKVMDRSTARMSVVGAKMSKSITLPVAAALAVSVDQAAKFQKQTTLLETAGGQTHKNMVKISAGIMAVAKQTGTSLSDLSEGAYIAAKASGAAKWGATDQLEILRAAAQGAKNEAVPLGTAMTALTSVMTSYGLKASDAVKAEDMLVRGSGLAKTTFADFAGSLSSVVPLAASLHINFAQVAGAIATMTQHGETAQRATDNLGNLISNLAGQNSVAAAAMGQLGISTVSLRKNLGARGLTGTLDAVEHALTKHSHAGLVVVSAFKQSANATASMNTMLKTMQPQMQTTSKQLLTGGENIKDYTTYAKSLGGQAGASALQFLALYKASSGFSNQLKSGNGRISTTATALQKMLGGVTGMRAALMLTGTSAKLTAGNVKAVGDAADGAGRNVLGWNKTSKLATTQLDKLKENAQTLSVSVGKALLPALSKLASEGSKAFNWIDGLDSGQKKILGWSLGAVAALGPVLSIGSRLALVGRGIGTFVTTSSARLAAFAGASELTSARVSLAMGGLTAAIGGVGIGLAIGTLTKNSSNATKALGALASTGAGAAIGFSIGGPVGAAVGGLAGGVSSLATSFLGAGDAGQSAGDKAAAAARRAQIAIGVQKQVVDGLTTAIGNDTDALGKNTRAQVANDLRASGALKLAQTAGLNPLTVTKAATGNPKAQAALQTQIANRLNNALKTGGLLGNAQSAAIAKLLPKLRAEGILVGKAGRLADLEAEAVGHVSFATRSAADQTRRYGSSLNSQTIAGRQNIKFIHDHVSALDHDLTTGKLTNRQWLTQIGTLKTQLKQFGFNSKQVDGYVRQFANVPKSVLTKLLADPKIANSAIGEVLRNVKGMPKVQVTSLTAQNNTGATLANLQAILGNTTRTRVVTIDANTSRARSSLETFLDTPSVKYVQVVTTGAGHAPSGGHALFASGGKIHGRGTGTSDSNLIRASRGEYVSTARSTSMNETALAAGNRGAKLGILSYAKGGKVGAGGSPFSQIVAYLKGLGFTRAGIAATLGNWKVESGFDPNAYNPNENAHGFAQWEGGRWTALQSYARAHGLSPTSTAAELGYFRHELHHGYGSTLNAMRTATSARDAAAFFDANFEGSSGSTRGARVSGAASYYKQLKGHLGDVSALAGMGRASSAASSAAEKAKVAAKALADLRVKIHGSDITDIRKALTGTVLDTKRAFNALFADMTKAKIPGATQAAAKAVESHLLAGQSTLITDKRRLAGMKAYRSTVTGALSQFDPTQYGSVPDLIAGLQGATATNRGYTGDVTKLHGMADGNKSILALINQLEASGANASLHALATGGVGQLRRAATADAAYRGSALAGGNAAVLTKYGTTIPKATAAETRLETRIDHLVNAISELGVAVAHAQAKPAVIEGKHAKEEMTKHADKQIEKALDGLRQQHSRRKPKHGA